MVGRTADSIVRSQSVHTHSVLCVVPGVVQDPWLRTLNTIILYMGAWMGVNRIAN